MSDQDWIDRLASQYGTQQRAALRGDDAGARVANNWIHRIADDHWHEIIAALRILREAGALRVVDGRQEQPDKVGIAGKL